MRTGAFIAGMAVAACVRVILRPAAPAPVSASEAGRTLAAKRSGDFAALRLEKARSMYRNAGLPVHPALQREGERP